MVAMTTVMAINHVTLRMLDGELDLDMIVYRSVQREKQKIT